MSTCESILPPREKLVQWLTRIYRNKLSTTTGGNLSLLDDDGTCYITPSGEDKAVVSPSDVAIRRPGKDMFEGPRPPSVEWPLHTATYKAHAGCRAIVHAHSTALIAFSLARENNKTVSDRVLQENVDSFEPSPNVPDTRSLLSAWYTCGKVAFVPYFPPGSSELASACANALSKANCAILQNHGVVTVGANIQEAYSRFITLEYLAQTIFDAIPLGSPSPLTDKVLYCKRGLPSVIPLCPSAQCCCKRRIMTSSEKEGRFELCRTIQRACEHGIFTASSGSISIRVKVDPEVCKQMHCEKKLNNANFLSFLITPTKVDRWSLHATDICYISSAGGCTLHPGESCAECACKLSQTYSSEYKMCFHPRVGRGSPESVLPSMSSRLHSMIYQHHPEINSIILSQPVNATAFCITKKSELDSSGIPESHLILGHVKTLPFESLEENGLAVAKALDPSSGCNCVLIQGLGLLSVGIDPLKAYIQAEVCESICSIYLMAMRRGSPLLLSEDQVKHIDHLYKKKLVS